LTHRKPWFDEEYLGVLDHRKLAKIQRIHYPSKSNIDNLNNVKLNASRHFRKKEGISGS